MPAEDTRAHSRTRSDRLTPWGWRRATVRAGLCLLTTLLACGLIGIGATSASGVVQVFSFILGVLGGASAASAAIVLTRRIWPLLPTVLATWFCMAMIGLSSLWYLADHGTRITTTVVSTSCEHAKGGGLACTARLRRPDGSLIGDPVAVDDRPDPGEHVDVVEDPAGLLAPRLGDHVDPADIPVIRVLLIVSIGLLVALWGVFGVVGERTRSSKAAACSARHGSPA
ncbi:hypothetical protein [Kutzneria sp. NPDC051319]|uniref:hypothetical protein n=1 Tax=Kutzneria sp. NPDC051319 TaxID=3155047 RepID=UPI0034404C6A